MSQADDRDVVIGALVRLVVHAFGEMAQVFGEATGDTVAEIVERWRETPYSEVSNDEMAAVRRYFS